MAIDVRYDFVLLFDVENGNPNGDPDAGNMPRLDPETMNGLVTDGALKRKIRDYVLLRYPGKPGYDIFVKHGGILNNEIDRAYEGVTLGKSGATRAQRDTARDFMCSTFWDVRAFGAVLSTGKNAGQVRGPVQLTFGRSADPIVPMEISLTRVAFTQPEKAATTQSQTEMGRKHLVPYGLYRAYGFVSAPLAEQTGFDQQDLDTLWEALVMMFEHDRSAARGLMTTRGLYIFRHEDRLGRAPAHSLFDLIQVKKRTDPETPVRAFSDYDVLCKEEELPDGVSLSIR
ncbi:MAG: type I-C CRISPR-associated protein Cas7/Csd2 [Candidatus Velthaea sp.]